MNKTKKSLIFSTVSLLLCLAMLVGSTFAWFTDSVTSAKNKIVAGNLDVELEYLNAKGEWESVEGKSDLFDEKALWEPGHTEVVYLRVVNIGTLALKYRLGLNIADEIGSVNVLDKEFKLSDFIKFGAVNDVEFPYADRETARDAVTEAKLIREGYTKENAIKAGDPAQYVALVVYMPEDVGNEANYKTGCAVPKIELGVTLVATQMADESDDFDNTYDEKAEFPEMKDFDIVVNVPVSNGVTTKEITAIGEGYSVIVPVGVKTKDDSGKLGVTVKEKATSDTNLTLNAGEIIRPIDVHVDGVADDNTVPIVINLGEVAPKGLNIGNYTLYHVENDQNVAMSAASSAAELDAHNEFYYDPATGEITVAMASFSEVAVVAETDAAWKGSVDHNWYEGKSSPYMIANADQLWSFSQIVGGMAEGIEQDNFSGKTVKLVANINLGDKESENNTDVIFYPIGYHNDTGSYEKVSGGSVTSNVSSFEGTFDGNGNTISNFYQNTWEMFGDYNNGYSGTPNHYKDAMGLFGYVVGGKICNLTVDNFSSDGEFTPTGVIAAYAVNSTFENIAITNCNPRVYNTGNGGIVGIGGNSDDPDAYKLTFTNVTIDNSNKITALWGSWDVACGGLVGMFRGDGHAYMTNCHVAAQIDVYNDVCGNYQYYWYRYSGMMIGTNQNMTTDANGYTVPETEKFHAENCTVHFGDWNDYYYCELVANSLASYTHDHQFSRLEQIQNVSEIQDANGKWTKTGNFILMNGKTPTETCYHIMKDANGNLYEHKHDVADATNPEINEVVNGETVLKENNQRIYLPFNQLFTGYGWGVKHIPVYNGEDYAFDGITILDRVVADSVKKFETKFTGDFLYRVGNKNAVDLGTLFEAVTWDENKHGVSLKVEETGKVFVLDSGVWVKVEKIDDNMNVSGTFTANTSDWTKGTIQFSGTGVVKVTIQDYFYCEPTVLYLEVVDATNLTSASGVMDKNVVLLNDVTYSDTYLYYKNSTLYGNGFSIDITGADHSDLTDTTDTNSNKAAYCNIWMVDSRFDNVRIDGSVYPEVGMTADSDYGNAAIRTEGDCYITNSYVSNCRVPVRVQGDTTLIHTVVDGGRYANIELRSGKLTLDGVTTINTVRKGSDDTTDVIGFGIVIHSEASNASIAVVGDGLKQYNWVGENKHKTILSGDSYLSSAYKLVFDANNSDSIYFDYNNDRYVNTGIICLCADMNKDVVTGLDDRYCQEVSGYDAWVLTYDNSKHTAWFNESVDVNTVTADHKQQPVIPTYTGNSAQTVEFTKGETYYFDTSVLTAEKLGQSLTISSVVMNGTTYNYGDKIAITEGGEFEIVYTVVDPYNYNADASSSTTVNHTVSITVTAIAKDAEILAPKFTFIDQNGNKYESTTVKAGDKTYVMPNVTTADPTTNSMSSINIGSASISGTTVYFPIATGYTVRSGSNFNRYYPLFNGINITDYTIAGDTTGTTYTTSGNYTSLVGSSGTKFIIPANGGQTNCDDYVKTDGQSGNAAGNSDSGWQGAGYSTSYGGTYLKSGNTNASSGADSNGYERIVWVEYCFNAGNGDVYYYRIGYHCNEESAQSCVTGDTLVTLADGTQKRIDQVTYADQLLVWDFYTGTYVAAPAAIIFDHGYGSNTVIALTFSDGTVVKVVNMHQFLDADLNKFVTINAAQYVGHRFVKQSGEGYTTVTLVDYSVSEEYVEAYGIISASHYNIIVEGMLSTDFMPQDYGLFNYFDIGNDMIYDQAAMQADIEKYGLYTYEEFADCLTYEQFVAFNVQYMKVAVGKGTYTYEGILALIEFYLNQ